MQVEEIIQKAKETKRGTFIRIVYETILPVTAAARKLGYVVTKRTEKVVRLGVNYGHIAKVIEQEAASTGDKRVVTPWYHWVEKDLIAKHNTKDDYYISFATVNKGSHSRSSYFINGQEASFTEVADSNTVIPSYFKSSGEAPVVQKVNVNNIIELGGSRNA